MKTRLKNDSKIYALDEKQKCNVDINKVLNYAGVEEHMAPIMIAMYVFGRNCEPYTIVMLGNQVVEKLVVAVACADRIAANFIRIVDIDDVENYLRNNSTVNEKFDKTVVYVERDCIEDIEKIYHLYKLADQYGIQIHFILSIKNTLEYETMRTRLPQLFENIYVYIVNEWAVDKYKRVAKNITLLDGQIPLSYSVVDISSKIFVMLCSEFRRFESEIPCTDYINIIERFIVTKSSLVNKSSELCEYEDLNNKNV